MELLDGLEEDACTAHDFSGALKDLCVATVTTRAAFGPDFCKGQPILGFGQGRPSLYVRGPAAWRRVLRKFLLQAHKETEPTLDPSLGQGIRSFETLAAESVHECNVWVRAAQYNAISMIEVAYTQPGNEEFLTHPWVPASMRLCLELYNYDYGNYAMKRALKDCAFFASLLHLPEDSLFTQEQIRGSQEFDEHVWTEGSGAYLDGMGVYAVSSDNPTWLLWALKPLAHVLLLIYDGKCDLDTLVPAPMERYSSHKFEDRELDMTLGEWLDAQEEVFGNALVELFEEAARQASEANEYSDEGCDELGQSAGSDDDTASKRQKVTEDEATRK